MTTFQQFHEEDHNTFHNETKVYFSQCENNRKLSLSELLRFTSDSAVEDYRQRGLSSEFLKEHGFYILVSRAAFRFLDHPHESQNISIITWEEKPEPIQLRRGYKITDTDDGRVLVYGYSTWLLVSPETRRIVPAKLFTLRKPVDVVTDNDCPQPGKILVPAEKQLLCERTIGYSDIDANGHTNNSRYGAFIADAIPPQYHNKELSDFRINYSKEAMLGQKLKIYGHCDDTKKKISVCGETEDGTSFEAELLYK
ncbi:MAG: acyl-[Treponema sp.]|nr:acyl-[acyl-carrier-protein] thioesterase [Treponema sp.]